MRILLLILIVFQSLLVPCVAQTLGGNTVYNFLKLPNTPQLTALGGINISQLSEDIGLSFNNPSLLRPSMHTQTDFVFNSFYAGIRNFHLMGGWHSEPLETTFSLGVNYFTYGSVQETDASGNLLGTIKPSDYVIQASASRQYMERWHYGATLKFIHSGYGQYRSSGIAADVGVSYIDTTNLLQISFVAKNMGVQLSSYAGTEKGELPFDMQLGISKRLAHAPVQFSLTLHHLQQFNILYSDTAFNNDNDFRNASDKSFTFDKLFRHVVMAVQLYVGDKIEITAGYNYLRRKELNIGSAGNGLNGFSLGVGALFKKLQIRYARSYYQNNSAYNQFGLSLKMSDLGGGKKK
ncbi:MAG: type IX secretion system protein PorQ [Chitinophagaceae bacterium]